MKHKTHKTYNRKTVLVTGAFGGIGRAICSELILHGHGVIRVSRRIPELIHTRLPASDLDIEADLASFAGWERVMESVQDHGLGVDTLIHSAGNLLQCDVSTVGEMNLRKMIEDNILSTILGCRTVLPRMAATRQGSIIILGSLGGIIPMPLESVYSATKFAVRGFTLSLAEEFRESGVTISLVSCGPVRSPMLRRESKHSGSIGFFNRPLMPRMVARTILGIMEHPRRETVIPKSSGFVSRFVGGFPCLFRRVYPFVSAVGQKRKIRFASRFQSSQSGLSRRQP